MGTIKTDAVILARVRSCRVLCSVLGVGISIINRVNCRLYPIIAQATEATAMYLYSKHATAHTHDMRHAGVHTPVMS